MSTSTDGSRAVVIRTSRETLALLAAAGAMSFAMAGAVHTRRERMAPPPPPPAAQLPAPQQDWAGHLAELGPTPAAAPSEPMSSATMVVPKSQLALPALPAKLPIKRPCLEAGCAKTPSGLAAAPPKRGIATAERLRETPNRTLLGMLNPLNHLPDVAAVGRPFTYAGSTVAGWFKRL